MSRPTVYLCRGKDCSRCVADRAALDAEVRGRADVVPVRCQKICKGPVAGAEVDGRMEWFARLDGPKVRKRFRQSATAGRPLSGGLRKRRSKKRSGRPPR